MKALSPNHWAAGGTPTPLFLMVARFPGRPTPSRDCDDFQSHVCIPNLSQHSTLKYLARCKAPNIAKPILEKVK